VGGLVPTEESRKRAAPRRKRTAILAAAARLFYEKGFEATSIQEVAEACGLTKAGLYHHIRSKEDLLLEVILSGLDAFEAQVVRPALQMSEPLARLRTWIAAHIGLIHQPAHREATVIIHERLSLPEPVRERVRARKRRLVRTLEGLLREAQAARQVRATVSPKVAAFALIGMVLWTSRWYRPEGPLSRDRLAQEMCELFLHGLATPSRLPPAGWGTPSA